MQWVQGYPGSGAPSNGRPAHGRLHGVHVNPCCFAHPLHLGGGGGGLNFVRGQCRGEIFVFQFGDEIFPSGFFRAMRGTVWT